MFLSVSDIGNIINIKLKMHLGKINVVFYPFSNAHCHISFSFSLYMVQGHQYETVSGFICEAFGYIPRTGESIKVVLEKDNEEEKDEENEKEDPKEKHQIFKLEVRS